MRLVYVTVSMPFGTSEEFLISEVRELLRLGHEVLIVPRSPARAVVNHDAAGLEGHSLRRPLLGPSVLFFALVEMLRHPLSAGRAFALLRGSRNRAVFARNVLAFPKGLWLARVARAWRADHIHAHWGLTTATMAMVAGEVAGVPWSMTLHRGDIAASNLLAAKMDRAGFVRFISQSGRDLAARLGAGECPGKAFVIHMGVVLPAWPPVRPVGNVPFVVLCPANLYPVKGHAHLVRAMAILRDRHVSCELRLAGQGGLLEDLMRDVDDLDLGNMVDFLGHVPHEGILEWFGDGSIDVVVLPSVDLGDDLHEGIPVALMEAMAHGIVVISTETGGIPELLHDGAGILVPPRDPGALADAIERLIRDAALRTQYGAAGRRRIEEAFAVERTVPELVQRIEASAATIAAEPA